MTSRPPPAQLGLFGGEAEVSIADRDPALVALAAALPPGLRLGTSSWTFRGWRDLVYRRAYANERDFVRRSLEEYARHPLFRTVGVDRSFYAPLAPSELRAIAGQVPPDFRAALKVWQEITTVSYPSHARYGERAGCLNPHFLDVGVFTREVAEPIARELGDLAGARVLEIPPPGRLPDRARFERALVRFFEEAPRPAPLALELRDKRLLHRRHFEILRAHDVAHVWSFWSRMPPIREQLELAGGLVGPVMVARLLLPPGERYESLRDEWAPFDRIRVAQPEMREDVVRLVRLATEAASPSFVIANNKAEGCSPLTLRALAEMLARA